MNPNLIVVLSGCLLLNGACTSTPGEVAPEPELPPLPVGEGGGPLRAKPSFANARKLSDSVKVGMTQQTIEAMFGPPDEAGYRTFGRSTESPWRALVWEWVFQDVQPARAFNLVFQEDRGVWRVNHGDWP